MLNILIWLAATYIGSRLGGFPGLLMGGALAWFITGAMRQGRSGGGRGGYGFAGEAAGARETFLELFFSMLGHMAKADGRVSQQEIAVANSLMDNLQLSAAERAQARVHYRAGRAPNFALDAALLRFRSEYPNLRRAYIGVLIGAAVSDGEYHAAERQIVARACALFGYSPADQQAMEAQAGVHGYGRGRGVSDEGGMSLEAACKILGVKTSAPLAEAKSAYRKMARDYHPDTLAAKDLPQAVVKLAEEKMREINRAYDVICKAKGA